MTNDLHTYRALIIDDEAHMRDTLGKFLKRYCPEVMLVGEASGVKRGIKAILEIHPDLILLDINMDDGTGFDLLHAFKDIDFRVIFISAFDKNSILAFNLSGLVYLAKPISPTELSEAIKRVMLTDMKDFAIQLEALEGNLRKVDN
ncbi:MAG: response regulator [Bacteroidales bacterium]|nr:response regulator [Bacteroidales bacterium]